MKNKRVIFLGGVFDKAKNSMWGGTVATSEYFREAFNGENWISFIDRSKIKEGKEYSLEKIKNIIKGYDIIHVDDSSLLQIFYKNNLKVDIIGPITRAPSGVKDYKDANGVIWSSIYDKEWFYKKKIIRLNANEEKNAPELLSQVNYIDHGVPTNKLLPSLKTKKYVLWQQMIKDMQKILSLEKRYEK